VIEEDRIRIPDELGEMAHRFTLESQIATWTWAGSNHPRNRTSK
jgi:hypothetical protein